MLEANHKYRSIAEIQKAISDGKTTVRAIVEQYLKAIEELDPELNAVTAVNKRALDDAEKLDVSITIYILMTLGARQDILNEPEVDLVT